MSIQNKIFLMLFSYVTMLILMYVNIYHRHISCIYYAQELYTRTESQNHRMVGVGRDLCGSSSPTLLPKQGHLQ